jgi:hypothetical protein
LCRWFDSAPGHQSARAPAPERVLGRFYNCPDFSTIPEVGVVPSIAPRVQLTPVDVVNWEQDPHFGIYPVGARAKEAVFSPTDTPGFLTPNKRYLFKRSKRSYPDQFWGEVIAYRVGCVLGVQVPPAFYAFNSKTGVSAALIEWFYDDSESFLHGGDFLERLRPDYDREVGTKHNLDDVRVISTAMQQTRLLAADWRQWWVDALVFDALIGNTDRHQDNWGFVFSRRATAENALGREARMAPLFDNGTSLGHERFTHRVAGWQEQQLRAYIERGTHHVKWSLLDQINGHFALLEKAIATWSHTVPIIRERLQIEPDELIATVSDLLLLEGPAPLSQQRFDFIVRLLTLRLRRLQKIVQ